MHAFLVSQAPSLPDHPDVFRLHPDKTLGIDEVRQIQTFLSKKPLSAKNNTVIIYEAEKLTLPAQHAILKILEEPPGVSLIYLVTDFPDDLLPTIISRLEVSDSLKTASAVKDTDLAKTRGLITSLVSSGVGERLQIIDDQNFTRDSALKFLRHLEYLLHQDLQLPVPYTLIHTTRKYLSANVAVRLAMDHFALSLGS